MTSSQIIGIAFVIAGVGDLATIFWLRSRMPPERVRIITMVLVSSAAAMMGLGLVFLMR